MLKCRLMIETILNHSYGVDLYLYYDNEYELTNKYADIPTEFVHALIEEELNRRNYVVDTATDKGINTKTIATYEILDVFFTDY